MPRANEKQLALQRNDLGKFLGSEAVKKQMALALPKHMTTDRMLRLALSAASRTPILLECTTASIGLSLIKAGEMGLEPDGHDGHLVPVKNKGVQECNFWADYKGLVKLAYQSELVISVRTGVVRKGDQFDYELGTGAFVTHRPEDGDGEPGEMTHAYAIAEVKGGGKPFVVMTRHEVMQHRKASQSASKNFSPWSRPETEPAMWKKTAVRELVKLLPRSPHLQAAILHEQRLDLGEDVLDVPFIDPDAKPELTASDAMADRVAGEQPKQETKPPAATSPPAETQDEEFAEAEAVQSYTERLSQAQAVGQVEQIGQQAAGDAALGEAAAAQVAAVVTKRTAGFSAARKE